MKKIIALLSLTIALSACGGGSKESPRAQDCNQQLDSIEQAFGRAYPPNERKDHFAECMAHPRSWFTR